MTVILREALKPNLVQTIEGQPAFVHCGPFANIAHGNSSLVADPVGAEARRLRRHRGGFASDMGMEKFFDIVCRLGGLPERGRARRDGAGAPAPRRRPTLARPWRREPRAPHRDRAGFGIAPVVAVNRFPADTDAELEHVRRLALEHGAHGRELNEAFERGGAGAESLAAAVVDAADTPNAFELHVSDSTIRSRRRSRRSPRASTAPAASSSSSGEGKIKRSPPAGSTACRSAWRRPICRSHTTRRSRTHRRGSRSPSGTSVPTRAPAGSSLSAATMQTMPGLGANPAAFDVDLDEDGRTVGLF